MAMTVMNNPSTMMTLGELNKNVSSLGKQLKKVSTGTKINGAGDSAAEYNIAEKMQVQIRGLFQDIENTRTGRSILKIAEGSIQSIVDELRNMKQLAINAANDTNTDADRTTIQKEFDEKLKQIEDIVATTNYNGKLLLNGEYGRSQRFISSTISNDINDSGSTVGSGSIGSVSTGVIEPNDSPTIISNGNYYAITVAGVYVLGPNFTGDIDIADGLVGVKIKQATSNPLNNVYINGPASGNANLWIEGLNILNGNDQSWIRFSGSDNVLSIKGSNTFNSIHTTSNNALINIGNGLTIEGAGSLEMYTPWTEGAMIGTDRSENSSANLTINSGTYVLTSAYSRGTDLPMGYGGFAAMIGAGAQGNIGDITINGGTFDIFTSGSGADLGGGDNATVGNITIKNANFTGVADDSACIGSGTGSAYVGNITIENSIIHVESKPVFVGSNEDSTTNGGIGAGIDSGGSSATAGDITVRNSTVYSSSNRGAGIGSGYMSHAGNIVIENMSGEVTSRAGESIGKGQDGTIGTVNIINSNENESSNSSTNFNENIVCGNPLIIHTGTKANQCLNCYIENISTKALFNVETDKELKEIANVRTRTSAQRLLGDSSNPNIEGPLDKAINYALNEITQVGSYINRLESTENTLTM